MQNVIVCDNVWKIYNRGTPAEVRALKGVSFKVKRGDFISIIGSSGSGKSTLLNCLGSLDKPTRGKCIIDGTDTSKLSEDELSVWRRHHIGFVFQFFNLIPSLTAVQNVELPMVFSGVSPDKRREKAIELLKSVGLEQKIKSRPSQLSGGETQRVGICRSLVNDPSLILADEPTGNLDSRSGRNVIQILRDLNMRGKSIVIVTHDINIANQSNRIVEIADGAIKRG